MINGFSIAAHRTVVRNRTAAQNTIKRNRTRFTNPPPTTENKCMRCIHVGQETTDDVACCNCCDDGEFFDPVEEDME